MNKLTRSFCLCVFLLIGQICAAQIDEYTITSYGREQGLYTSRILDVCQDDYGFLWLGTYDGLYRFDGISFTRYSIDGEDSPSTTHQRISTVIPDSDGYLWCLDRSYSLHRFNTITLKFEEVMPVNTISRISSANKDEIWALCMDNSCMRFRISSAGHSYETTSFSLMSAASSANIHFHETSNGKTLLYCGSGIFAPVEDEKGNRFSSLTTEPAFCVEESDGVLYFGSSDGKLLTYHNGGFQTVDTGFGRDIQILTYVPAANAFVLGSDGAYFAMYSVSDGLYARFNWGSGYEGTVTALSDKNGRILYRGSSSGIYLLDWQTPAMNLLIARDNTRWDSSNMIRAFFSDSQGNLWFSTVSEGLKKLSFNPNIFHLKTFASLDSPSLQNSVRVLFQDKNDRVWVSTRDGRLHVLSGRLDYLGELTPEGRILSGYRGNGFGQVYSMLEDSYGSIWIGTKGDGLYELSHVNQDAGLSFNVKHYSDLDEYYGLRGNEIYDLAEDSRTGRIWIATTDRGLGYVDLTTPERQFISVRNRLRFPSTKQVKLRTVHIDMNGDLFAGGNGLYYSSNPDGEPEDLSVALFRYGEDQSKVLDEADVFDVFIPEDGNKYVSVYGVGLGAISKDNLQMDFYTTSDGLLSNFPFYSLVDNSGFIWTGSEEGLNRIDRDFRSVAQYPNGRIGLDNHLTEGRPLKASDGTLMFPSLRGIIYFNPRRVLGSSSSPRLVVTDRILQSHSGKSKELEYDNVKESYVISATDRLTVKFLAVDLSNSNSIVYSYKVDGRDEEWVRLGATREIELADLKEGNYTLHIKSTNGDGVDANNEWSMSFIVNPPFWKVQTIIFGIIGLFAIIALVVFHRRRKTGEEGDVSDEDPLLRGLTGSNRAFVEKMLQFIRENASNGNLRVGDIAAAMNVSKTVLFEKTKNLTGKVPSKILQETRLDLAAKLLSSGEYSITEVADLTGFCDSHYFSKSFKSHFGVPPSVFKHGN